MNCNCCEENTGVKSENLFTKTGNFIDLHEKKLFMENIEDRVIWLDTEISTTDAYTAPTALSIEKQILRWNKEDAGKPYEERTPIKLLIFCYGGELDLTNSLCNVIELSKTPVYTYNMGLAASGGFYLLISGHKRFALKDSYCLIHEGSGTLTGSADDIRNAQNNYEYSLKLLRDKIYNKTKIDTRTYNKKKTSDWYLYADDMIKYGIVDSIITDIDDIN